MPVYKDEKRNTWYVKYSTKDPVTGKRKQVLKRGFILKREALQWETEQKSRNEHKPSHITFRQLAEQYYAYNRPKERTQQTQMIMMEKYFSGYDMPLNRLTKAFLTDWYISFTANDLKTSTKNLCIKVIRAIFRFGSEHFEYHNPASMLKTLREPKRKYETWDIQQFQQFIESVDNDFYHTLFMFYYFTGCRQGEALHLLKSDFDLDHGTVHIQRNLKTEASNRVLKLPQPLLDELKPLLDIRAEDEAVFPVSPSALHTAFKKYTQKSGVPEIRIHDLRHSFATNAIGHGNNIVAVSRYMGHSTTNQTMRTYAHLLEKSDDELISSIGSWIKT